MSLNKIFYERKVHENYYSSPGQGCNSQFSFSIDAPTHAFPPKEAGVITSLVFVLEAVVPHVALHSVMFQGAHLQSTVKVITK